MGKAAMGKTCLGKHRTFSKGKKVVSASHAKKTQKCAKLRSSITWGTVLILLAGRFRGRRVVFLKQLEKTGLLLVTGPYNVNGVPLRRVNQRFCIATSTKIAVDANALKDISDDTFARESKAEKRKRFERESAFFRATETTRVGPTEKRRGLQETVDKTIKVAADMKPYLKAKFSLSANDYPHAMKF